LGIQEILKSTLKGGGKEGMGTYGERKSCGRNDTGEKVILTEKCHQAYGHSRANDKMQKKKRGTSKIGKSYTLLQIICVDSRRSATFW